MKSFLKQFGIIIELVGVLLLISYAVQFMPSNTLLVAGGATLLLGLVFYISANKYLE